MAEYIERSVAKEELLSWARCIKHPEHLMTEDAMYILDGIPAADVVEVVRCKDCKHWNNACCGRGTGDCHALERLTFETFFCSYGERKGGGADG